MLSNFRGRVGLELDRIRIGARIRATVRSRTCVEMDIQCDPMGL